MIVVRSKEEIATMRRAGRILAGTLAKLEKAVAPGIETRALDAIARDEILKHDGYPAFKGYKGYPANICTSVNDVVVHGIPSDRRLQEGDIIAIDVGVKFRDYYADAAITVGVGRISENAAKLIDVTKRALYIGIDNAVAGMQLSDVSCSIQDFVEANGFSVVRALVGHGIGLNLHEEPEVPNFGKRGTGVVLEKGMMLAIEPMVNAGTLDVEIVEDGWTVLTKDRRLSAHFEHTVAVGARKAEILTVA